MGPKAIRRSEPRGRGVEQLGQEARVGRGKATARRVKAGPRLVGTEGNIPKP